MLITLLAEADPALSGGWIGAGLLGGVLSWLMFKYLPAKDAQVSDLIDKHNILQQEQAKQSRADFHASLQIVIEHCSHEMEAIILRLGREVHTILKEPK